MRKSSRCAIIRSRAGAPSSREPRTSSLNGPIAAMPETNEPLFTSAERSPSHASLLAAIGSALETEGPFVETLSGDEGSRRVLAGAMDPGARRVAWVEEAHGLPKGGLVPVSLDFRIAEKGTALVSIPVETYNPYFGCVVGFMRLFAASLAAIYREKHRTLLACIDAPYEQQRLYVLDDDWVVDGDAVYFSSREPGLLDGLHLPSGDPLLPLPIPAHARVRELRALAAHSVACVYEDGEEVVIALPPPEAARVEDPTAFTTRLAARIKEEAPRADVERLLLAEALCFAPERRAAASTYDRLFEARETPRVGNSQVAAARQLARFGRGEIGWGWPTTAPSPEEGQLMVALSHLRRRVAESRREPIRARSDW